MEASNRKTNGNVKYTGGLVLLAKEEALLQSVTESLHEIGRRYGMEMNVEKPKAMRISRQTSAVQINHYPTAFPYGNGMVLHFYHQQESSTTKTVHKVINKGLKTYV